MRLSLQCVCVFVVLAAICQGQPPEGKGGKPETAGQGSSAKQGNQQVSDEDSQKGKPGGAGGQENKQGGATGGKGKAKAKVRGNVGRFKARGGGKRGGKKTAEQCENFGQQVKALATSTLGDAECCKTVLSDKVEYVKEQAGVDFDVDYVAVEVCSNFGSKVSEMARNKAKSKGGCRPESRAADSEEADNGSFSGNGSGAEEADEGPDRRLMDRIFHRRRLEETGEDSADEDTGLLADIIAAADLDITVEEVEAGDNDLVEQEDIDELMKEGIKKCPGKAKESCDGMVDAELSDDTATETEVADRKGKAKKNFCQGKGMEQLARNKRIRAKTATTCADIISGFDDETGLVEGEVDARPIALFDTTGDDGAVNGCEIIVDIDLDETQSLAVDTALANAEADPAQRRRRRMQETVESYCSDTGLTSYNEDSVYTVTEVSCGDAIDGLLDADEAAATIEAYSDDATGLGEYYETEEADDGASGASSGAVALGLVVGVVGSMLL